MRALLVYPEYPSLTYWSFSGALPYIRRRASMPPLALITIAAMLPKHWDIRLVDMNIEPLRDADLLWADVVLTSTMVVQAPSLDEVVRRCKQLGVRVVAGGPHPSGSPDSVEGVDHIFIGEAEGGIGELIEDLERGTARAVYRAGELPDVDTSPVPRFDLLDLDAYGSMAIQHSRGCPFSCEFCDIWKLYGRKSRIKSPDRMAAELDAMYAAGWRGALFFVDDNFIGNRRLAKRSLEAIAAWQGAHDFPFSFYTEASVNLGSDDELLGLMRDAGFNMVFLGIESPSVESLEGANKPVNANSDLLRIIRRIQSFGIEVSGGFIVGFDEDTADIFDRQVDFIREAGIPMAMVGILTAIEGTDLYDRLKREGRLLGESAGNNTHGFQANFETRMPSGELAEGYKRVMDTLYGPTLEDYFGRCRRLLDHLGPNARYSRPIVLRDLGALFRSLKTIPTRRFGPRYLRFLSWCVARHPSRFPEAVRLGIQGFHFEQITREALACDEIRQTSAGLAERFRARAAQLAQHAREVGTQEAERIRSLVDERRRALRRLRRSIGKLSPETRAAAARAYADALHRINELFSEHAPSAARAFEAGSVRLAHLRETLHADVERLRELYVEARTRAGHEVSALRREMQELYRLRRDALRRARREVRSLPEEYRLFGKLELRAFRRRLDDLLAAPAAA